MFGDNDSAVREDLRLVAAQELQREVVLGGSFVRWVEVDKLRDSALLQHGLQQLADPAIFKRESLRQS